jgi:hypothetical protein
MQIKNKKDSSMKYLFLFFMISLVSLNVFSQTNCPHKIEDTTGTIYIVPVYEAKATYFFDNLEKKSYAIVNWNLNRDESRSCFNYLESKYPSYTLKFAALRFDQLSVGVYKGKNIEEMIIYPEAGGFYNGSTDKINIDYNSKSDVIKAIESKQNLITITGEVTYEVETIERGLLMTLSCLGDTNQKGVLGLHKRLGEIIKEISARAIDEKINREEILDQFMTSCVDFKEVDTKSFVLFENAILRKTILIEGKIPVLGNVKKYKKMNSEAMSLQESTFLDY